MTFEAKIIETELDKERVVKSVTARIGGGVYRASGMGTFYPYDVADPKYFGFQGGWKTGYKLEDHPGSNNFVTDHMAEEVAKVVTTRGFGSVDKLILSSTSLPIESEWMVLEKLKHDHGIPVGVSHRHWLACNGGVFAMTDAAMQEEGTRVAFAVGEHLSPIMRHDPVLDNLFGDGSFVGAIRAQKDLKVLVTNTLIEADKAGTLRLPLGRFETLPDPTDRQKFDASTLGGTCTVRGDPERVFSYRGGTGQPLLASDGEAFVGQRSDGLGVMGGMDVAKYFGIAPIEVIKKTQEEYYLLNQELLNEWLWAHKPSITVYIRLMKFLGRAGILGLPKDDWTPGRADILLKTSNSSGVGIGVEIVNSVHLGRVTLPRVLITGFGIGHNITSSVVEFGE